MWYFHMFKAMIGGAAGAQWQCARVWHLVHLQVHCPNIRAHQNLFQLILVFTRPADGVTGRASHSDPERRDCVVFLFL